MIVPRTKLLNYVILILVPLSIFGALFDISRLIMLASAFIFLLIFLIDIYISLNFIDEVEISLADLYRLSQNKGGVISVSLRLIKIDKLHLKFSLPLSKEFDSKQDIYNFFLDQKNKIYKFDWITTPTKRGNYTLDYYILGVRSQFGFWNFRKIFPLESEIRVYPDISVERNKIAAFFLNHGSTGIHWQHQLGKGKEFDRLREYLPGDSYEDIHWKTTAKRQKPVTKIYQIERTQDIYLVLDISRTSKKMVRTTSGFQPVLEKYITSALLLANSVMLQNDSFGLIAFSDRIERFFKARSGNESYKLCRNALYSLKNSSVNPDYDELFTFISTKIRRRALLIFFTDLEEKVLWESFNKNIGIISKTHLVIVNSIIEKENYRIFTKQIQKPDELYIHLQNHLKWQNTREADKALSKKGVQYNLIQSEKFVSKLITNYINIKQRQLL